MVTYCLRHSQNTISREEQGITSKAWDRVFTAISGLVNCSCGAGSTTLLSSSFRGHRVCLCALCGEHREHIRVGHGWARRAERKRSSVNTDVLYWQKGSFCKTRRQRFKKCVMASAFQNMVDKKQRGLQVKGIFWFTNKRVFCFSKLACEGSKFNQCILLRSIDLLTNNGKGHYIKCT